MKLPRIVCAANRAKDGTLILGVRHFDQAMHRTIDLIYGEKRPRHMEQGFIDSRGDFLTRRQAWKVAEAAGQIIHRVGGDDTGGGTLYSENLY